MTESRASKVPHFTFSDTLEEQQRELAENPLMKRLNASRASLASDKHRPIYHYVNPESTLNDPNGLCFWQGRWHLFYQAYPPEDRRQHWGHAVSDDLVHWEDLPYAIYPDPEDRCFSGSAMVEDDRVIAIYHGTGTADPTGLCPGNSLQTATAFLHISNAPLTDGACDGFPSDVGSVRICTGGVWLYQTNIPNDSEGLLYGTVEKSEDGTVATISGITGQSQNRPDTPVIDWDADGYSLPDALVEIEGEARELSGDHKGTTRADANGHFAFDDLSDGVYWLARARGQGLIAAFRMIVFVKDGESHDIVLGPGGGSKIDHDRGPPEQRSSLQSDGDEPGQHIGLRLVRFEREVIGKHPRQAARQAAPPAVDMGSPGGRGKAGRHSRLWARSDIGAVGAVRHGCRDQRPTLAGRKRYACGTVCPQRRPSPKRNSTQQRWTNA